MRFGSLFAGIGGIDLGLERAGMECAWQVEIDEFCQKVLTKHWPDVPKYGDIRDVGKQNLETVGLIAGGFPCQPFSFAGKQRGTEDDRHLWPEMLRVISELKPAWVLGENVPGIVPIFLDQAIDDLETEGYTVENPIVLPALAFDAPHKRSRLFIIAHYDDPRSSARRYRTDGNGSQENKRRKGQPQFGIDQHDKPEPLQDPLRIRCNGGQREEEPETGGQRQLSAGNLQRLRGEGKGFISNANRTRLSQSSRPELGSLQREKKTSSRGSIGGRDTETEQWYRWPPEPGLGRVADGVPDRIHRLKSLGNAVVPQVAEFIGRMILEANKAL